MKKLCSFSLCIIMVCLIFTGCFKSQTESITFANDNMVVTVGSSSSITVVFSPSDVDNRKLVWSSSDESVATVSDGKVTGVASGEATITALTENGIKANCTVKVKDIEATKVVLSSNSLGMKVGGKNQLTAKVYPAEASQEVEWASSDPAIVYVDGEGNLNAIKSGSATITATAENGKQGSCLVKVSSNATSTKSKNQSATVVVVERGNNSYPISSSGYIIPYSDYVKLTPSDVIGMSSSTIQMAINEIYARHGRKFETSSVASYFESMPWYTVNPYYSDSLLSDVENYNINLLASLR